MSVSDYKTHCFPSARPREHFSLEDSCKPISAGLGCYLSAPLWLPSSSWGFRHLADHARRRLYICSFISLEGYQGESGCSENRWRQGARMPTDDILSLLFSLSLQKGESLLTVIIVKTILYTKSIFIICREL